MTSKVLVRRVWTAVCVICLGALACGQDSANPSGSLGELARRTRAQHASADGKSSKAQELADEMQQEHEASETAPVGFKNYDAGDYRVFVPFPNSVEGTDNSGEVLLGSRLGITNTEVMVGTPVPIPANTNDSNMINVVLKIAQPHGTSASCSPTKQGEHKAFRCLWSGNPKLLDREVTGSMVVVVASNSRIPVRCVSPDDPRQCVAYDQNGYHTCANRNPSWEEVEKTKAAMQTRDADQRTTSQMCDQVIYPSIQLKEDTVVHPVSIGENKPHLSTVAATSVQSGAQEEPESQNPSLAELARRARQASQRGKAQASLDNAEGNGAPPGFQPFVLQYCQNPAQCSQATVVIPEKTEVVSQINGQHVFKTFLKSEPVMLYAGPADVNAPYRGMTDPDFVRIRELANSNGSLHEKTDGVSTQELTIEGKYSLMTRFRYQRDDNRWWVGERVLIQNRGGQFMLGCTAAENHFVDAEALCTTLVNSLRLP